MAKAKGVTVYRDSSGGERDTGRCELISVLIGDLYATDEAAQRRYMELWREYATEVAAELSEREVSSGR